MHLVPYVAILPTCSMCVCVRMCVCVGLLRFPPNIFSLTRHLNDVILNYVFFVEIPLIQFSCLLLVCPLLYFFLPSLVVFLLLPEEDLMSKVLVCLYYHSSSFCEYSFLVLFLTYAYFGTRQSLE